MTTSTTISPAEEARYAELQLQALDYARTGETAILGSMVSAGLPVNLADAKGNSLLMLAAYYGNADTVSMLLRHGADVDRRNDRGQTALGGVAFKGYADVARVLLSAGAQVDADQGGGQTPLMFAALFGRDEVAELLRKAGADERKRGKLGLSSRGLRWFSPLMRWMMSRKATRG